MDNKKWKNVIYNIDIMIFILFLLFLFFRNLYFCFLKKIFFTWITPFSRTKNYVIVDKKVIFLF